MTIANEFPRFSPDDDENIPPSPPDADGQAREDGVPEPPAPGLPGGGEQGLSVTPLPPISGPQTWRILNAGLDTVDLSIYVRWSRNWPQFLQFLEDKKKEAAGTDGILLPPAVAGRAKMLPGGKAPMYRFHLEFPDFHLWIGKSQESDAYPNTYVSISSKALWQYGLKQALDGVMAKLALLGGEIQRIVPSRVDCCCDFLLQADLTLDFLQTHKVCKSTHWNPRMNLDDLETFYMGARGAPIQLRIYNKYREIMDVSQKFWMFDVWQIDAVDHIWRVEYQLRREVLKQFKIDTIDDLVTKIGGVWSYLTNQWFSLRVNDNENPTRRSVHPWWKAVQEADWLLGLPMELDRNFNKYGNALAEFFVARAASNLPGFAVRLGKSDLRKVAWDFAMAIEMYWRQRDFQEAYELKAIDWGTNGKGLGNDNGKKEA